MDFFVHRCIVTRSLFYKMPSTSNTTELFFTTPLFCSDLSHPINRGPFYLLGKQVVMIVSQCAYDEKVSASMCFLFGMLHLLTHTQVWEGHSRYFWSCLRCCSNTTTHACSAVSGHSTVRSMCHFIPWSDCCAYITAWLTVMKK